MPILVLKIHVLWSLDEKCKVKILIYRIHVGLDIGFVFFKTFKYLESKQNFNEADYIINQSNCK